jgi:hypothetical protein
MRRQPNPSSTSYRTLPWGLAFLLIFLNAALVTEATAQNNPGQVVGQMIDLIQQLQRHKREPPRSSASLNLKPSPPPRTNRHTGLEISA